MKCIREPFLQFYYSISPFQTENKGPPVGRFCRRRGHRWLSWRQLAVPPVASGVVDFAVYGFLWFSVLDWYDIYTRFTVITTSLKCKRCFVSWFYYAWNLFFLLSHKLSFEYESRGSSFWRLWRRWWHHELSLRQLALPSVTAGLSVWWAFIFNARCTSFKCLIYVLNLNSLYIYS